MHGRAIKVTLTIARLRKLHALRASSSPVLFALARPHHAITAVQSSKFIIARRQVVYRIVPSLVLRGQRGRVYLPQSTHHPRKGREASCMLPLKMYTEIYAWSTLIAVHFSLIGQDSMVLVYYGHSCILYKEKLR